MSSTFKHDQLKKITFFLTFATFAFKKKKKKSEQKQSFSIQKQKNSNFIHHK
jgi:hypothetical protein